MLGMPMRTVACNGSFAVSQIPLFLPIFLNHLLKFLCRILHELGKVAIFGSKVDAVFTLAERLGGTIDIPSWDNAIPWSIGRKKKELISLDHWAYLGRKQSLTDQQLWECALSYEQTIVSSPDNIPIVPCTQSTPFYPTDRSLYWSDRNYPGAVYDLYDQPICEFARLLNIDTIILQHEKGEYRSVSEILDTRPNSYSHLVSVGGEGNWFSDISDRYSATWFLEYGFITKESGYKIVNDFYIDYDDLNRVKFL